MKDEQGDGLNSVKNVTVGGCWNLTLKCTKLTLNNVKNQ
jgi:hypothetical protein